MPTVTPVEPVIKFCIVESPYAPFTKNDPDKAAVELARNEAYVNACMADAFARGETPFASHAIYTRFTHGVKVLDDRNPAERRKGMQAGFDLARALSLFAAWAPTHLNADEQLGQPSFVRAFYVDRGFTSGMFDAAIVAGQNKEDVEKRTLSGDWSRDNDHLYFVDHAGQLRSYVAKEKV